MHTSYVVTAQGLSVLVREVSRHAWVYDSVGPRRTRAGARRVVAFRLT
jgi:hypothetical protein